MRKILILSYSNLNSDPRVIRQISALKSDNEISIAGYSSVQEKNVQFFPIYSAPPFSLKRKMKRFVQFLFRRYDLYYWDAGKISFYKKIIKEQFNVIVSNDIMTLPLALKIADKTNAKVWFDAHEFHPREFEDNWKWRVLYQKYISHLCKKYIPHAQVFSTVCDGIAQEYFNYIGILPQIITNASNRIQLKPFITKKNNIKLVHHGAAIRSRKIELMIQMMSFLDNRFTIDFILTGSDLKYINELRKLSKKNKNIRFIPPVEFSQICNLLNPYDIGVFLLPPVNLNYKFALPNKIFEFIQARLCIAVSPSPEMANLVRTNNLGVVSKEYTPKAMAQVINELNEDKISNFKNNAHIAANNISAEKNFVKMNDIVESLINNK
ncbi:MAG: hypothetical protein H0V01_02330 [Bacteroidetes bacterium]|nr:hypothetical protein [Bacteroidota bacterium]HET6244011.1 hypothetical protein [Bacteroidia bacterium]